MNNVGVKFIPFFDIIACIQDDPYLNLLIINVLGIHFFYFLNQMSFQVIVTGGSLLSEHVPHHLSALI